MAHGFWFLALASLGFWLWLHLAFDFGHLANSPKALSVNGGVIKSDVDSEFDKIFSPGLYFTFSHRSAPMTYGIGYSEGPNSYRTYVDAFGNESEVSKVGSLKIFIAIDLALFPL